MLSRSLDSHQAGEMSEITQLLQAIDSGDTDAKSDLFELVYAQLRAIAGSRFAHEQQGHTLQPTALVHETYVRLFGSGQKSEAREWQGSQHFYRAAANAMRQVLIESARRRQRQKRGGDYTRVFVEPDNLGAPEQVDDLLALDESMSRFAEVQPKMAELVRLRFFAGLTIPDAAKQLGIASRTANDYWAYAKVWLLADMQDHAE